MARPCQQPACVRLGSHHIPANYCPLPGEPLDPRIGRMLGGKYLLLDVVGEGGAGRVYLAAQQPIGLKAAVKVLRGAHDALASPERLRDEARALAEVDHPAVIRLLDFGEDAHTVWLVTEYVDGGRTLADALADGLDLDERHRLLGEVARGLAAAHAHGLVHRDVKPGNVLLQAVAGQGPAARLVDFGLAKFIDEGDRTDVVAGTLRYMAPEQALRRDIGPWTDWYAYGVMLCEAVLGRRPLDEMSPIEGLRRRCSAAYDPIAGLGAPVGPVTAGVVRQLLARRPAERPATLGAILAGLDAVVAERRASSIAPLAAAAAESSTVADRPGSLDAGATHRAPRPGSPAVEPPAVERSDAPAMAPPASQRRGGWRGHAGGVVGWAAGLLVAGGLVAWGASRSAPPPAVETMSPRDGRSDADDPRGPVAAPRPPRPAAAAPARPVAPEERARPVAARGDRAGPGARLDFEVIDLDALQQPPARSARSAAHAPRPKPSPRSAPRGRPASRSGPSSSERSRSEPGLAAPERSGPRGAGTPAPPVGATLSEEALEAAGRAFLR